MKTEKEIVDLNSVLDTYNLALDTLRTLKWLEDDEADVHVSELYLAYCALGTHVLFRTNAPESYDYGYSKTVRTYESSDTNTDRLVAIRKDRAEFQTARYASGLYRSTIVETEFLLR